MNRTDALYANPALHLYDVVRYVPSTRGTEKALGVAVTVLRESSCGRRYSDCCWQHRALSKIAKIRKGAR